jgi:hypothetical protein
MTPEEMILEQNYFRDKLRRHNRLLHGWGVVCGAIVCRVVASPSNGKNGGGYTASYDRGNVSSAGPNPAWPCPEVDDPSGVDPWNVSVSPGYILGPYGDEIIINCQMVVDVRKAGTIGISGEICPPAPDPWCHDVIVERRPGPVYLAVRYKEITTRPVRVQPYGCGCDDTACEYSRIRDGFEICTLDECPPSHHEQPPQELKCELRPCPPCPEDPWVVLARIDVDANGIRAIDNYSCRRILIAFHSLWCYPEAPGQEKEAEEPTVKLMLEETARKVVLEHLDLRAEEVAEQARLWEVGEHSALELRGVTPTSVLGRKLEAANMTIVGVGQMGRDKFVEFALSDVDPSLRKRLQLQAERVWERADHVVDALEAWKYS